MNWPGVLGWSHWLFSQSLKPFPNSPSLLIGHLQVSKGRRGWIDSSVVLVLWEGHTWRDASSRRIKEELSSFKGDLWVGFAWWCTGLSACMHGWYAPCALLASPRGAGILSAGGRWIKVSLEAHWELFSWLEFVLERSFFGLHRSLGSA